MVTDRVATTCLLALLAVMYPGWHLAPMALIMLDIFRWGWRWAATGPGACVPGAAPCLRGLTAGAGCGNCELAFGIWARASFYPCRADTCPAPPALPRSGLQPLVPDVFHAGHGRHHAQGACAGGLAHRCCIGDSCCRRNRKAAGSIAHYQRLPAISPCQRALPARASPLHCRTPTAAALWSGPTTAPACSWASAASAAKCCTSCCTSSAGRSTPSQRCTCPRPSPSCRCPQVRVRGAAPAAADAAWACWRDGCAQAPLPFNCKPPLTACHHLFPFPTCCRAAPAGQPPRGGADGGICVAGFCGEAGRECHPAAYCCGTARAIRPAAGRQEEQPAAVSAGWACSRQGRHPLATAAAVPAAYP